MKCLTRHLEESKCPINTGCDYYQWLHPWQSQMILDFLRHLMKDGTTYHLKTVTRVISRTLSFVETHFLKGIGFLNRLLSAKRSSHSSTQFISFRQCDSSFQWVGQKASGDSKMESWSYRKRLLLVFKSIPQSVMSRRERKKSRKIYNVAPNHLAIWFK